MCPLRQLCAPYHGSRGSHFIGPGQSLHIMQALQVTERMNIFSCTASALSVLYGLGDTLAMLANDIDADYSFSKTVYGTMSIFIDTTLRSMTLAYWMTISKAYVIIVPFILTFELNSKDTFFV